ncbi:mandelate racemase/muconate lactonizing enzyme family protein [Micromonospora echinospora]|uniref:mandelate racemase/muconate lactonizing enzyme family protein n=1 Tax=Micromonospora echinospora TaxID=1877 RepID=UPI00340721C2
MPVITRIEVATAIVPLPRVTGIARRTITNREYTLVRITADDGVTGIGFCYPGHSGANIATLAVRDLLAPVLLGRDADLIEGAWQAMYQEALLHGRVGSVVRGLSALDIALWDRSARAAAMPLHKYLGGHSDEVPAYASGGYYLDGKGVDGLAAELQGYQDLGFSAFKIKVGRVGVEEDRARIAAAREVVGPEGVLMLDANNAWSDLPSAVRALRRWEEFDPYFIEEPFGPDDIENHARLAKATSITVATGEIEAGRWRAKSLLDAEAAVILQCDAAVCGGLSELRKIADLASAYGASLAPHWFHDLHAPMVGAFPAGIFVEYFVGNDIHNIGALLDRELEVSGGVIRLHQTPGLGFGFSEEALDRYLVGPWEVVEK